MSEYGYYWPDSLSHFTVDESKKIMLGKYGLFDPLNIGVFANMVIARNYR
jgi:hypothetical protein